MATKDELEERPLFRAAKIGFGLSAFIIVGLTLLVWYATAEKTFDFSKAYIQCNGLPEGKYELTDGQRKAIESSYNHGLVSSSPESIQASKTCYGEYSGGKDPDLATSFDIQLFVEMQKGSGGEVYTIEGIQEGMNYHWDWLCYFLFGEYLIYQVLKAGGLYIAGGREALDN